MNDLKYHFVISDKRASDVRQWIDDGLLHDHDIQDSNIIGVAAGDGGYLHSIHKYYSYKKPFFGINRGTFGFLLSPIKTYEKIPNLISQLNQIPLRLISGEFITKEGKSVTFLAFNEIICGGNIADYITFKINGELSFFPSREVQGNGVFVTTAQGSTGYALNTRGTSALIPLDSKDWFVGGVATGPYPCDQVTPQRIIIEVESRKPVHGYADGYSQEVKDIEKIIITPTDITVTLAVLKEIDFAARRTRLAQEKETSGRIKNF